jgi:hypothetical protein
MFIQKTFFLNSFTKVNNSDGKIRIRPMIKSLTIPSSKIKDLYRE